MTLPGPATRSSAGSHAVLCELVPGGVPEEITAGQAARILEQVAPAGAVAQARCELAAELLADIRHLDAQLRETKKKLAAAVRASGTTLTEVFGVGPVIAATVIGDVVDVARFPSRDHFAAYNGTAPVEVSSGEPEDLPAVAARQPAAQPRRSTWPRSPRSATSTATAAPTTTSKLAEGKTHKEALRCLKRRISDAIYARLGRRRRCRGSRRAREGNRGTTLTPARPAHTPNTGSSDKPLPDPLPWPPRPGKGARNWGTTLTPAQPLTPRTPALRTSHSRTRHHPTARRPNQRHPAKARVEENPAGHLTTSTKRTRYARRPKGDNVTRSAP